MNIGDPEAQGRVRLETPLPLLRRSLGVYAGTISQGGGRAVTPSPPSSRQFLSLSPRAFKNNKASSSPWAFMKLGYFIPTALFAGGS